MTTLSLPQEEEYTGRFNLDVWKKLFGYTLPYRRHLVGLCAVAIAVGVTDSVFPLLTRRVINDVADRGRDANLVLYAFAYFGLTLVFSTNIMLLIRLAGRISTGVSHDIRQKGFDHLQELSFSFYDRRPAGWLVARLTSDCDRLSRTIAWGSLDVVWGSCLVLGVSVIMLVVNWKLALLVLGTIPVLLWVSLFFQKRILRISRAVRKQNSNITAAYNECITGVRTTKTMVREEENLREFDGLTHQMCRDSIHGALLSAVYFPIVITVGSVGAGLALWVGGVGVSTGRVDIGTLIMFISYSGFLFYPILEMARVFADLQSAQAAAERVLGLIDTVPDVKDTPEVLEMVERHGGGEAQKGLAIDGLPDRIEEICFRDVCFAYNQGQTVLENFNLAVRTGQTIALVGPTGGGKSTIVSLMCRFYEPTSGGILINGIEYRKRSLHWLQSNLGIVLQEPHLFSGMIRENIRYGRLDADDEEVEQAADLVRAHDFIVTLDDGYDSEVGEGGGNLSMGQKQLVSFARAVLADPQIFVMDEATSSVDTETEQLIQQGLHAVLKGRISFIIAHRLSTIRSADLILVIDGGRVIEQGNHGELIARKGPYYELYTSQFAEDQTTEILTHAAE